MSESLKVNDAAYRALSEEFEKHCQLTLQIIQERDEVIQERDAEIRRLNEALKERKSPCGISRERFLAIISRLQAGRDLADGVNKMFHDSPLNTDFMNASGMAVYHDDIVTELLDIIFASGELMGYWILEDNFGQRNSTVFEPDGSEVDIHTPELLYDYLTRDDDGSD